MSEVENKNKKNCLAVPILLGGPVSLFMWDLGKQATRFDKRKVQLFMCIVLRWRLP